ncbi:hypothetical protein NW765_005309 [Fusarium oxysporum]|nr:hypothetical protein NW765_005309 [Fusarium oxysporum]
MLRKEKLFEIKVHGLPKKKKRELEATLRDFAASLEGSPNASSTQNIKKSRHATREKMYSESGSKHASSSSGSNFRPADSAYASMSTGANSGTSLSRPSMGSQAKSSEAVESYLRDIPEGLYPRHMIMTDKERKKLVVRRLEQLFTGKIRGRHVVKKQPVLPSGSSAALAPVVAETQPTMSNTSNSIHEPPALQTSGKEPTREARILPLEQQSGHSGKKSRSADNASASNSNGDNTESGGNGNSTGSGTNTSPPMTTLPEQRPHDLVIWTLTVPRFQPRTWIIFAIWAWYLRSY